VQRLIQAVILATLLTGCTNSTGPSSGGYGGWIVFQPGRVMSYDLYADNCTGMIVRTDLNDEVYYRSYNPDLVYQVFPVRVDYIRYYEEDTVETTEFEVFLFTGNQVIFWKLYNELPDTLYQNESPAGAVLMDLPLVLGAETVDNWFVGSLEATCDVPAGIFEDCSRITHTEEFKTGGHSNYDWYFSQGTGLVFSETDTYIWPDHFNSYIELESITNP